MEQQTTRGVSEVVMTDFVAALRALIAKYKITVAEVQQALVRIINE
jgi:hypothetical protein